MSEWVVIFVIPRRYLPNCVAIGCKYEIGESRKLKTGLPVSPRKNHAAAGNDK